VSYTGGIGFFVDPAIISGVDLGFLISTAIRFSGSEGEM
jgi:hypothetical protein